MASEEKNRSIWDRIFGGGLIAIVVILVFMAAFFTYTRMKNEMVSIFGYSVCYVLTGSMEPTLMTGDVILIKDIPAEDIVVEQIVTYKSTQGLFNGQYITHRVKAINDLGTDIQFMTLGDANNGVFDTEFVNSEKIVGVYVRNMPVLTVVMNGLSNPIVFLLIIILPLGILLISQIFKIVFGLKEVDKLEKENEGAESQDQLDKIYGNKEIEDYINSRPKKNKKNKKKC